MREILVMKQIFHPDYFMVFGVSFDSVDEVLTSIEEETYETNGFSDRSDIQDVELDEKAIYTPIKHGDYNYLIQSGIDFYIAKVND